MGGRSWKEGVCAEIRVAPSTRHCGARACVCVRTRAQVQRRKMLVLQNEQIRDALRRSHAPLGRVAENAEAVASVNEAPLEFVYLLCLDAHPDSPEESASQRCASALIRYADVGTNCGSHVAHCEVVIPPVPDSADGRVHFATYLEGTTAPSEGANWQNRYDRVSGIEFYLFQNGPRWRALPLVAPDAVRRARAAADANVHAPYSTLMYATSSRAFRRLAKVWSDAPGAAGHCAVITARVLRNAGIYFTQVSAWYSPSTLYNELLETQIVNAHSETRRAVSQECNHFNSEELAAAKKIMLTADLKECQRQVRFMGDRKCRAVVESFAADVYCSTESAQSMCERQRNLASVLLKWVLLREDDTPASLPRAAGQSPLPDSDVGGS